MINVFDIDQNNIIKLIFGRWVGMLCYNTFNCWKMNLKVFVYYILWIFFKYYKNNNQFLIKFD